jgi:hypothetical protein
VYLIRYLYIVGETYDVLGRIQNNRQKEVGVANFEETTN